MKPIEPIPIEAIEAARERIRGLALRTPLVKLNIEDAECEIYLKLENLQPIGSFKLRGAGNAMRCMGRERLAQGVYTASAGNMAQGVAWVARELGVGCSVIVPEHAPQAKLDAVKRLGGEVIKVPFDEWWQVMETHEFAGCSGVFIHPVCQNDVIAGNGTIGLEILEDLPDVDAVVVPYGGGGLSCGIASAIHASRPRVPVFASEIATAAPLAAAFKAGGPVSIDYTPSFVEGIGGKSVLPQMWTLVKSQIAGSQVMSPDVIADAVRVLATRGCIVAEGAGASSVAAALSGRAGGGKVACVVSGGNINPETLATILQGATPGV